MLSVIARNQASEVFSAIERAEKAIASGKVETTQAILYDEVSAGMIKL